MDSCKRNIDAHAQPSSEPMSDLEEVCEEAAQGDEDGAQGVEGGLQADRRGDRTRGRGT